MQVATRGYRTNAFGDVAPRSKKADIRQSHASVYRRVGMIVSHRRKRLSSPEVSPFILNASPPVTEKNDSRVSGSRPLSIQQTNQYILTHNALVIETSISRRHH